MRTFALYELNERRACLGVARECVDVSAAGKRIRGCVVKLIVPRLASDGVRARDLILPRRGPLQYVISLTGNARRSRRLNFGDVWEV